MGEKIPRRNVSWSTSMFVDVKQLQSDVEFNTLKLDEVVLVFPVFDNCVSGMYDTAVSWLC